MVLPPAPNSGMFDLPMTPLGGDIVEISDRRLEHRLVAGVVLPALHRKIDVSRRDCGGSGFLDSGIS